MTVYTLYELKEMADKARQEAQTKRMFIANMISGAARGRSLAETEVAVRPYLAESYFEAECHEAAALWFESQIPDPITMMALQSNTRGVPYFPRGTKVSWHTSRVSLDVAKVMVAPNEEGYMLVGVKEYEGIPLRPMTKHVNEIEVHTDHGSPCSFRWHSCHSISELPKGWREVMGGCS